MPRLRLIKDLIRYRPPTLRPPGCVATTADRTGQRRASRRSSEPSQAAPEPHRACSMLGLGWVRSPWSIGRGEREEALMDHHLYRKSDRLIGLANEPGTGRHVQIAPANWPVDAVQE